MLKDLILKSRSYRRFFQNNEIPRQTLEDLVSLARITPSAANKQPLKFVLANSPEKNELIFKTLAWAGYLPEWKGPEEGEKPSAYIVVLGDRQISTKYYADPGIVMQTILLGAVEKGYGGCIFASINRPSLAAALSLPGQYEILYVIALGKPLETVVLEDMKNDDVKYWRDGDGVHHVPKRKMDELILSL